MKSSIPVNFTVAPMNNATNAGMTASITLAKTADQTYAVLWNV